MSEPRGISCYVRGVSLPLDRLAWPTPQVVKLFFTWLPQPVCLEIYKCMHGSGSVCALYYWRFCLSGSIRGGRFSQNGFSINSTSWWKEKKTIDHTYATNISQTIGIIGQYQPIYFSVLDYTEDHGLPKQEILCHSNLCVYYSMAQLIMLLISRAPAAWSPGVGVLSQLL
jgi:hypothetical protein